MLNKIVGQTHTPFGTFSRYVFLAFYLIAGAVAFWIELLDPGHDLFSVLRGISLYIMLVLAHLAQHFTFGPRLQAIVRVAAILSFVACFAVLVDKCRNLRAAQTSQPVQR